MQISDRPTSIFAFLLLVTVGLGGCEPVDLTGQSAFGARNSAVLAIRVAQRDVIVVGPDSYCVDKATRQERATGSFVMLGSCAALRGEVVGTDPVGVLTALVSQRSNPPQRPTPAQMEQFFRSPEGRAALALDGTSTSLAILSTRAEGDVLYLTTRDDSPDRPDDLSAKTWRAVFPLVDRLVALSVASHKEKPLTDTTAQKTLEQFVKAVISANTPPSPKPRPDDKT